MIVQTETFYCDKCGRTDETKSTNVPYLGWVFIDTHPREVPGGKRIRLHICWSCWRDIEDFIREAR